jgi:hypothetical protein
VDLQGFESCMGTDTIDQQGFSPLKISIDSINIYIYINKFIIKIKIYDVMDLWSHKNGPSSER